jgi:hypothetical protein
MFSFLCVNDNKDVDINNPKIICYIYVICYNNLINAFNIIIKAIKSLISYYKTTFLTTFNFFDKEMNSPLKKYVKKN